MTQLRTAGMLIDPWGENSVMRPMFDGFQNPRDIAAEIPELGDCHRHTAPENVENRYKLSDNIGSKAIIRGGQSFYSLPESEVSVCKNAGKISIHYTQ